MKKNLNLAILQTTDAFPFPPRAGYAIEILSSLQITQLIFITMSSFTQTHQFVIKSLAKNLPFFTGGFSVNPSSQYHNLVAAVFGFFMAYLILHICLIIATFAQISLKGSLNKTLTKIMAGLYLLHSRIIFFPCQFFLSNLATLSSNNEFYQSTGWFLTIIFLSILNFALAIPKEFLLYQVTQTKDIYSCKSNLFHQLAFIYKALLLLLLIHAHHSRVLIQITSILHVLFCSFLGFSLWKKLPFYDFYIFRLILILTTTNWSFALISIIQVFASSTAIKLIGSTEILILLLPILAVKFTFLKFRGQFEKILQGEFTSPEDAIHYGILIEKLSFQEKNSNLHSLGFLPDEYQIAGALASSSSGIYENIVERLEGRLTQNPKSEILLIYLADLYLSKLKNVPRFLQVFRRIQGMNYSRFCKKAVEDFYQKLDEVYHEENGSISRQEVQKFFADNQRVKSIYDNILKEISLHINIWKDIENKSIDMKKTMDHALAIDKLNLNLLKQFEKNLEGSQQNLVQVLLLVQIVYLNNVRNLIHETRQLIKFFHLKFPDSADTLKIEKDSQSSPTAFIVVSLDKRTPGIVLDACGPIDTMFSIKKSTLLRQNFGCLFPTTIAKIYQANLQEYAKNPTYKLDHKYKTCGKNSQGEMFELEALFQLYCYNGKEIAVVVILKKISEAQMTFIANTEGMILDCSTKAYRMIQDIALDLEDANKAFNIVCRNQTEMENSNKNLMVTQREYQEDSFMNRSEETARPLKTSGRLSFFEIHQNLDTIQPLPVKNLAEEEQKATKICEEFLQGKSLLLLGNEKQKTNTMVRITPCVFHKEVYKIVTLSNFAKNNSLFSSSQESLEEKASQPDNLSPVTFADEFPGELEDEAKIPNYEASTPKKFFFKSNPKEKALSPPQSDSIKSPQKHNKKFHNDLIQIAIVPTSQHTSRRENLNREIRISRTLQEISTSKTHTKNLKFSLGVVYTSMFSIFIMSILNCMISYNAINNVEIGLDIVYVATRKATWSITLWQDALSLYLEARSPGFITDARRDYYQGDIITSSSLLKTASTALEEALSSLNPFLASRHKDGTSRKKMFIEFDGPIADRIILNCGPISQKSSKFAGCEKMTKKIFSENPQPIRKNGNCKIFFRKENDGFFC